jgi:hypothetical protein
MYNDKFFLKYSAFLSFGLSRRPVNSIGFQLVYTRSTQLLTTTVLYGHHYVFECPSTTIQKHLSLSSISKLIPEMSSAYIDNGNTTSESRSELSDCNEQHHHHDVITMMRLRPRMILHPHRS